MFVALDDVEVENGPVALRQLIEQLQDAGFRQSALHAGGFGAVVVLNFQRAPQGVVFAQKHQTLIDHNAFHPPLEIALAGVLSDFGKDSKKSLQKHVLRVLAAAQIAAADTQHHGRVAFVERALGERTLTAAGGNECGVGQTVVESSGSKVVKSFGRARCALPKKWCPGGQKMPLRLRVPRKNRDRTCAPTPSSQTDRRAPAAIFRVRTPPNRCPIRRSAGFRAA